MLKVKIKTISHDNKNVTIYQVLPVYQAQGQVLCT